MFRACCDGAFDYNMRVGRSTTQAVVAASVAVIAVDLFVTQLLMNLLY